MAIKIYKRLTSGTDADYTLNSTLADAATSETVTGLTADTAYTFKIVREVGGVQSAPVVIWATTEPAEAGGTTPTITSFTPTTGEDGDAVTITGTNFTGATSVTFNGVSATFTVLNATSINATVPTGVTTGKVSVTTPEGTVQSGGNFTVMVAGALGKILLDGNSLMAASGFETGVINAAQTILTEDGLSATFPDYVNFSVPGQTTTQMIADAGTQVDPAFDAAKDVNVMLVWEATNHLYGGATGQQAFDEMAAYCTARKTAHPALKIAVGTVLPRSNSGTPAGFEAQRLIFNDLLRDARADNVAWLDAIFDAAAEERIGDAGDETNGTYYIPNDLVHLNSTGNAILFKRAGAAIVEAAFGLAPTIIQLSSELHIQGGGNIVETNGVLTTSGSVGDYNYKDLFYYKLAANTDGALSFKVPNAATDKDAIIGFAPTNTATHYSQIKAGVYNAVDGIRAIDNGTSVATGSTLTNGQYLIIRRESGVYKIYKTSDGRTLTLVYTLTYTSTIELYGVVNMAENGTLSFPRAYGMVETIPVIPPADGYIDWANATPLHVSGAGNITETNNVLTTAAAGYGGMDVFNMKLPANTDGWLGFQAHTSEVDAILGIRTANTAASYSSISAGMYKSGFSAMKIDGGGVSNTGTTLDDNDYYILYRISGVWKLFKSSDGLTLTLITTLSYSGNGEVFAVVNMNDSGTMSTPRCNGFVAA